MVSLGRPEDAFARKIREISDIATLALREARRARSGEGGTTVVEQTYVTNNNTTIENPDLDLYFLPFEETLASVPAGGEISGSIAWNDRSLCNLVRVTMTVDTELEFMLLRQPVFDSVNRPKHRAFYATGVGNYFMREGGALFDYADETASGMLHYWFHNVGLSATVPTLVLNKRVPQ